MKILQVIPYFWPSLSFGGPVKVTYQLCEELSKNNEVTVFTSDAFDDKSRIEERDKIQDKKGFRVVYSPNIINRVAFLLRFYTNFGIIFKYLFLKNKYDIVHIHDVFSLPQILVAQIAHMYKKPYVLSTHGIDISGKITNSFTKKAFFKMCVKDMLLNAETVIATSDAEAVILKGLGFKNIKVIYNGLSIERVELNNKSRKYNKSKSFTILYIGRINKRKGLMKLIEAVKGLNFPMQVLIVGPDDGEKDILNKRIEKYHLKKKIRFMGFADERRKEELYKISDLFIYPSELEGFSISILEAMIHGLPVLISEACNFPDVVKYKAGKIVPTRNMVENISSDLEFFNADRKELKAMGVNAKKLVLQKYSVKIMSSGVTKIYENSVKKQTL